MRDFDPFTQQIIGHAIEVHRELGPGLLETAYEPCLLHELTQNGISCVSQLELPVKYKGMQVKAGYRIDLLLEEN